jgi:DNA-binding CsgD family transcriptional regulator/tetratricopeptide (TPR) repeat protein
VVEQLSVIPTHVVVRHAICLLDGRSNELTRAEEFGVLQMHDDGIGFPHELARRAVEQAIPAARRHALNARVVQALLYHDPVEGVAALVHHAVEANDVDTVLQHAPLAAEQATRAGSHRQALAHFEAVMPYIGRLPAAERADLLDRYAWELHIAHRLSDSLRASGEAVLLLDELDEPVALAETLLRQSRLHYTAGDLDAAVAAVERAVSVAESVGCPTLRAAAVGGHAMMLVLIGQPRAAIPALEQALDDAVAASRTDLIALCTSYLGLALADLGLPGGLEHLRASIDAALSTRDYEAAARGYTNLAEILYRQCRWDELADCLHRGREFSRERGFGSHEYHLEVHEALLLVRRGDWQQAERTLRRHLNSVKNVGIVSVASTSALGRLLARRGDVQAESLLGAAWDVACKQRSLPGLADAGSAYAEWAWLNDRADIAWSIRDELAGRPDCLSSPAFSEVSRYLARANIEVPLLVGGPLGYEQGLRGHWRSAAETWEELRDPYEQALELAESGNTQQTSQALQILDRLGAAPAVVIVRRRLKELGVRRLPRRLRDRTRANPGQLTDRQIDVLMLLADGLTNAEIAEKLVVSVRTVDHHVSAILSRLDAPTRQHAAAAARGIGLIQDREATVRLA